ncbi:hypothetical protein ACTA71_003562 [Dictyostelium dimigraforme]
MEPEIINPPKILTLKEFRQSELFKERAAFRRFDMHNSQMCKSNSEIAAVTKSQSFPEPMCMTDTKWSTDLLPFTFVSDKGPNYKMNVYCFCKPIACFLDFQGDKEIAGTVKTTLTKKKGSSKSSTIKVEATASAGASIMGCEAKLSVTSGYSYTSTEMEETTETWEETLTPGSYYKYQNIMMYAFCFNDKWGDFKDIDESWRLSSSTGIKVYYGKDTQRYFFFPVYRDDCFTKLYKEDFYSTVSFDEVSDYLTSDGKGRWYSDLSFPF